MRKQRSWKFWIIFWFFSGIFLLGWYSFWEIKNGHWNSFQKATHILPVEEETKKDMRALLSIADFVLQKDGVVRTYMILFQNNYELRPGGGFIGSFGILKMKDGKILDFSVHDTGNFDGRIPSTVSPPYPMKETLHIDSWKLRDSNYSPDFPTNAVQAEEFYTMGGGEERFDGVVGITTDVLVSFLSVTGPVDLSGFPGTFGGESAVWDLEYQVEKGYVGQGIEKGERKSVMNILGWRILDRVKELGIQDQYRLFEILLADLHEKDIQLFFDDSDVSEKINEARWGGIVDRTWKNDSFLAVDANLGSFKSDYFIKRSYEYTVDFSKEKPVANFSITYEHTAEKADWRVKEYQSFFRLFVPKGSWMTQSNGFSTPPVFGEEYNRKYFGSIVHVPVGGKKTVSFEYILPETIRPDFYELKITKQPGIGNIPVSVVIIKNNRTKVVQNFILNRDASVSFSGELFME